MRNAIDGNELRCIARRRNSLAAVTAIVFALAAAPSQSQTERAITNADGATGETGTVSADRPLIGPERSGEKVVQSHCVVCHQTGVDGAPKIGDRRAWIPRAKYGFDVLTRSAINGHRNMPPRGGMANLTDGEVRAAIAYMLNPVPVVAKVATKPAAKPDPNHRIIDGTEIYFGVVSAETIRKQHPGPDPESKMHKGIPPPGGHYHHVNISLFDAKTGNVISGAQVEARVADPVRGDQVKVLEPMVFNKSMSYGNYFRFSGNVAYTVAVLIRKPGDDRAIQTKFEFRE